MATRTQIETRDREWYDRNEAGESQASIAEDAGVTQSYVSLRIKKHREKHNPRFSVQHDSVAYALAERSVTSHNYTLWNDRLERIDWSKIHTMGECLVELRRFMSYGTDAHIALESRPDWNDSAWNCRPFQRAAFLAVARMVEIQRKKGFAGDGVNWLRDLEELLSQNQR